jgi:hypothetical protein
MRARTKTIISLAALALAVWAWFTIGRDSQPSFAGEPLVVWARRCAEADTPAEEREAAAAIAAMGWPAQHLLTGWLHDEYFPQRHKVRRFFSFAESALLQRVFPWGAAAEERAELALGAFHVLGASASNCVPELVTLLADPHAPLSARRAGFALSQIGEPALDPLLHLLADDRATNRDLALAAIAQLNLGRTAIARAWLSLKNFPANSDPDIADAALYALGRLDIDPDVAVPALLASLSEPRARLRERAIGSLEHYANSSYSNRIAEAVQPLLGDSSTDTREAAMNLLQSVRPRRRLRNRARSRFFP